MNTCLPHLDVGSGRRLGAITLFPVWSDAPTLPRIEWRADRLEAGELSDGAEVNHLSVRNLSALPTVLLEGDLLVGGWQHRMAASSTVLAPRSERVVDVVCVEQGRWDGGEQHVADGSRGALSVRRASALAAADAQGEVWRRISRYDERLDRSATASMLDHLRTGGAAGIRRMPGQRGVIVGIGGRVLGLELFGSARGLAARWDGLIRAALLDARLAPPVATPAGRARDFVRALGAVSLERGAADGSAAALRCDQGRLRVSGIAAMPSAAVTSPAPIHLTAFDDAHPLLEAA